MMRLSYFRSEETWKEIIERNERLAIEVGRLRGDLRVLRQKNSKLLLWKLNITTTASKPILTDTETQTESVGSLLAQQSDQFRTPLRTRQAQLHSSGLTHQVGTSSPNLLNLEEENDKPEGALLHFSPIQSVTTPSPTQQKVTRTLGENVRNEHERKYPKQFPFVEKSRLTDHRSGERGHSQRRQTTPIVTSKPLPIVTPHRASRSVKKPISYREPSLTVKVRKGFQFFKFIEPDGDIAHESSPSTEARSNHVDGV